ncbi:MAG TPA: HemK/PrmC family methyltransferase [Candidatus Saccharimonadales bacterium]|nr:HemK/PrmC family methyltransferase [Candidatus Saccharimonadales bacterium]
MTTDDFLQTTAASLHQAGIASARLDSLILLEDALGLERANILAHPEHHIPTAKLEHLNKQIAQRATHRPLAYIRGKAAFYGREFTVNEHVLVPRPESETMITLLKSWYASLPEAPKLLRIADIGAGSGMLGITGALELPKVHSIAACDIDRDALAVALQNAYQHRVTAIPYQMDLLETPFADEYQVLLANLPYVPETLAINQAATFEPKHAIFSGPDGLDHYKRFWAQVGTLGRPPLCIITESLPAQHHAVALLARSAGFVLAARDGFAQLFVR